MGLELECPYCGASRSSLKQINPRVALKRSFGGFFADQPAMKIILVFNLIVYVAPIIFVLVITGSLASLQMVWSGPNYSIIFGEQIFSSPLVREGNYMGLLTANFLHLNLLHLLFNSYALWVLSPDLEEDLGFFPFLSFYMVAGVGGFLISSLAGNASGGASSALFGLIAAHIFFPIARGDSVKGPMFSVAIQWAMFSFIFGLVIGADNHAHAGGFLFGTVLAYVFTLTGSSGVMKSFVFPLVAGSLLALSAFGFLWSFAQRLPLFGLM